jgi:type I restriction enzyme S subunit
MSAVPELRFPEFEGAWSTEKLGTRTSKVGSGATPRGGSTAYVDDGIPFIRSQNIRNNRLDLSDAAFIPAKTHRKMSNSAVCANDVLLNITGASIGRSAVVSADFGEGNVNQHVCIIRLDDGSSPAFLQAYISSHRGQKGILQAQSGSGREGLNFENIRNFKIAFPTLPEQQKIAAFLGSVDDKIDALRRKHDALKQFKAGLMQKLFSQELRFKRDDGSDYPEWEEKRLEGFSTRVRRKAESTGFAVLTISAGNGFVDQEARFNKVIAGTSLENYTHLRRDEFSYNRGASLRYPYGCIYRLTEHDEALVPYVYRSFKLKTGVPEFFEQYFKGGNLDRQLRRLISSSARLNGLLNIGVEEFYGVKVPYPHLDEQQHIADCLSAVDAKIEAVDGQVTQMEAFKKGLLQKMFV